MARIIDDQTVQALLAYLEQRPFREVAQAVQVLSNLPVYTPSTPVAPETPPTA